MAILPAPSGIAASVVWNTGVPTVTITSNTVAGATRYRLARRYSTSLRQGHRTVGVAAATPSITDTGSNLISKTIGYVIYAIDASNDHGKRSAEVIISIPAADPGGGTGGGPGPTPQPGDVPLPPVNLRGTPVNGPNRGYGVGSEVLQWDPRSGAASYNVYWYENVDGTEPIKAGFVTDPIKLGTVIAPATQYTIPNERFHIQNMAFVTTVDAGGMESIPSAFHEVRGWMTTTVENSYSQPYALAATGEWNGTYGRVKLFFKCAVGRRYRIYRAVNGGSFSAIASNIMRQYYLDEAVSAGNTYTYKVASGEFLNGSWVEGSQSAVSNGASPLTAQPEVLTDSWSATPAAFQNRTSNVSFVPFPQARDYRAYPQSTTADQNSKYSAGGLIIQVSGLSNTAGTAYYVEALDKEGPFQMQNRHFPGLAHGSHAGVKHVGGTGDPSNVPSVLKRVSATLQGSAFTLAGAQAFFDDFSTRGEFFGTDVNSAQMTQIQPPSTLVAATNDKHLPMSFSDDYLRSYENGDASTGWTMHVIGNDMANTNVHVHAKHMMTINSDGGTPRGPYPRANNNGKMLLIPRKVFDWSTSSKILHVTWCVDASFTSSNRRWCGLLVKSRQSAGGGDWFKIMEEFTFHPVLSGKYVQISTYWDKTQINCSNGGTFANKFDCLRDRSTEMNSPTFLDRRVKFDFYLRRSDGEFRYYENGVLQPMKTYPEQVPVTALQQLDFAGYSDIEVCFAHATYHLDSDRLSLQADRDCAFPYYINHQVRVDERHWQDMGFEEVAAFPV